MLDNQGRAILYADPALASAADEVDSQEDYTEDGNDRMDIDISLYYTASTSAAGIHL